MGNGRSMQKSAAADAAAIPGIASPSRNSAIPAQARPADAAAISKIANQLRISSIRMTTAANSGHPGGSLSSADAFATLYFGGVLAHDPANPSWEGRDRFILSNGHICPVWYSALGKAGYFPESELATFRQLGSRLQGHPQKGTLPSIEVSTGSLGQGFCVAAGLALGLKMDGKASKVFVSLGDGEVEEGCVWEAAMASSHYKLENLIAFVDRNGLQQNGPTEKVMGIEPLADKWRAFGWNAIEADGHDARQILGAFNRAKTAAGGRPTVIIFKTVMGKGVPFMENDHQWHGKALPKEKAEEAVRILEKGA